MKHRLPADPDCPRCGRPMVASYALGWPLPGGGSAQIPLGHACVNRECVAVTRLEQEERDRAAIRRAIDKGVINE